MTNLDRPDDPLHPPSPRKATRGKAAFSVGQVVHHKLFGYRGVVIDADAFFQGGEAWYEKVAQSRPPKDRPWYHVLVDGGKHQTYVAERNLEPDTEGGAIDHPAIGDHFATFHDGVYVPRSTLN